MGLEYEELVGWGNMGWSGNIWKKTVLGAYLDNGMVRDPGIPFEEPVLRQ